MEALLTYRDLSEHEGLTVTLHEPDARVQHLPEALIQDLWRRQDFDHAGLRTTTGEPIHVLDPGSLNRDGGPDFSAAHVRIGEVEWVGDVEIHRTSGEWMLHRHDEDAAYDRVILHVALVADRHTGTLHRAEGSTVPELVLLPHLTESLRSLLYRFFAHPDPDFPCAPRWAEVPDAVRKPWLRLLGQERLRGRLDTLAGAYHKSADLDEVLWQATMRALGYAPNADAMETLARRVPLRRLRALDEQRDAEALLLGTAGLLPTGGELPPGDPVTSEHVAELRARFASLQQAEPASVMASTAWQFARLRPANFPTRRIAQAAALVAPGGFLHTDPVATIRDALYEEKPAHALRETLTAAQPDPYWRTHTRPGTRVRETAAGLGQSRANALLLNALLPTILLSADRTGDIELEERTLDVLASLPAPDDRVVRTFERHGPEPRGALEAQGLHQLYRTRCTQGRCLSCSVGRWLLDR